jgi:hypothetical protein
VVLFQLLVSCLGSLEGKVREVRTTREHPTHTRESQAAVLWQGEPSEKHIRQLINKTIHFLESCNMFAPVLLCVHFSVNLVTSLFISFHIDMAVES